MIRTETKTIFKISGLRADVAVEAGELHEELEEQRIVDDVFGCLCPVYQLLNETLLDGDHAIVENLSRIVAEQPMHNQVKESLHSQVILLYLLYAIGYHELV